MPFAPLTKLYSHLTRLVEQRLWAKVLLGLAIGVATGFALNPTSNLVEPTLAEGVTSWLALPGNIFIGLVQMIMIPLVVASIIQGIAGEGNKQDLARMGVRVTIYFLATTLIAIAVGVILALLVEPGAHVSMAAAATTPAVAPASAAASSVDLPSIISGLLPSNPLASMLAGEMLSIVIFAVVVGIALVSVPRSTAEPILNLLFSVQEICMTITRWAMKLAPLAVFGLMARIIAQVGLEAITGLGIYILTVLAALATLLVLYSTIIVSVTPVSLGHFFRSAKDVLLLAFSVASSAAVMPLSMRTAERHFRVPPEVARFIIPVGAIINMNGTAAYQAIATLFLAQVYGMDLSMMSLVLVVVTTVAASIGTPSAPGAGIIVLATVLTSVGVPVDGIALIIGVDHILGMCRTTVNVAGDLTACLVFTPRDEKRIPPGDAGHAVGPMEGTSTRD